MVRRTWRSLPTTGGTITGDLAVVDDLDVGGDLKVDGVPIQNIYATYANADVYYQANERVVSAGEFVLRRRDCQTGQCLATSGNLYVTHFRASVTETIATIQTNTGGSGTVAVDAEHAWIGILSWNPGTGVYTPGWVSVDDPTRWVAEFTPYDTPIFAVNPGVGSANLSAPGFAKVAGQWYAYFVLWVGTGQAPLLTGNRVNYADSMVDLRENAYMGLSAPPSGTLQPEWLAPDERQFQGFMKR